MFAPNSVVVLPFSEIAIKTRPVRSFMEKRLKKNISLCLEHSKIEFTSFRSVAGRMLFDTSSPKEFVSALENCFGIHGVSASQKVSFSSLEDLSAQAVSICDGVFSSQTFAVRGKSFSPSFGSKKTEEALGSALLKAYPKMKVKLSTPEVELHCIAYDSFAYFFFNESKGALGLPVGVQGKAGIIVPKNYSEKDLFSVAKNLLKCGCSVVFVSDSPVNLSQLESYNSFQQIRTLSLKEACERYALGRLIAFFSLAKTTKEAQAADSLVGVKCFAPLLFAK